MDKRVEYFELVKPYKDKVTTAKGWDDFITEQGLSLPSSANLTYAFETWNDFKSSLGLKLNKKYTKQELKNIALEHKEHMKTKATWDKYSKEHSLPSSKTFIKAFEKWSSVKDFLKIEPVSTGYSKEDIQVVLKEHGSNYESREQWDQYAKNNELPTYKTIRGILTYDEMYQLLDKPKKKKLTQEDLILLTIPHKEVFLLSAMNEWNEYAREYELPKSETYFRKFGSWKQAQQALYNYEMKEVERLNKLLEYLRQAAISNENNNIRDFCNQALDIYESEVIEG